MAARPSRNDDKTDAVSSVTPQGAPNSGWQSSPAAATTTVAAVGISDEGRHRDLNEDCWRWEALNGELSLYAVADGMGGHDRGEVASSVAVETLFSATAAGIARLDEYSIASIAQVLLAAFKQANQAVVDCGRSNDSNMGTTLCVALMFNQSEVFVANVGDSRCYRMRDGQLTQITKDHSLVAYLVDMGELTREQARTHPSGNILVRSVGSASDVNIDFMHVPVRPGDLLLLCSDGLWGEIPDDDIAAILRAQPDLAQCARSLVETANRNGGKDNITAVLVRL